MIAGLSREPDVGRRHFGRTNYPQKIALNQWIARTQKFPSLEPPTAGNAEPRARAILEFIHIPSVCTASSVAQVGAAHLYNAILIIFDGRGSARGRTEQRRIVMAAQPLMPKATAVWLVENTALTFDQIADFCKLHPLEVKAIADDEGVQSIIGRDPIVSGQITRDELARGE